MSYDSTHNKCIRLAVTIVGDLAQWSAHLVTTSPYMLMRTRIHRITTLSGELVSSIGYHSNFFRRELPWTFIIRFSRYVQLSGRIQFIPSSLLPCRQNPRSNILRSIVCSETTTLRAQTSYSCLYFHSRVSIHGPHGFRYGNFRTCWLIHFLRRAMSVVRRIPAVA